MKQEEEEQWIVVVDKKKSIRKEHKHKKGKVIWNAGKTVYQSDNEERDIEEYCASQSFRNNKQMIEEKLKLIVREHKNTKKLRIECVGLGDFLQYSKPRFQFYMLKYMLVPLCESITKEEVRVNCYDPVFSKACLAEIEKIGTCENTWEEEPNKDGMTLYFMPHCERFMYEKVCLFAGSIIIGNSINDYCDRCELIQEQIPENFCRQGRIEEVRLKDYRESLNDTYVYFV